MDTIKRPLLGLEDALNKLHKNHNRISKVALFVDDDTAPLIVVLENGEQVLDPDHAVTVATEIVVQVVQYAHGLPAPTTATTT